jgi:hypothetical protein
MYTYNGSVDHTVVDVNATPAQVETVDAMSILKRFDTSNRVGTGMDGAPATDDRKDMLRVLIRETTLTGSRRHARKLQDHFNGLRTQGAVIPALQVEAAIRYLKG